VANDCRFGFERAFDHAVDAALPKPHQIAGAKDAGVAHAGENVDTVFAVDVAVTHRSS
jgi:hypothetical protein